MDIEELHRVVVQGFASLSDRIDSVDSGIADLREHMGGSQDTDPNSAPVLLNEAEAWFFEWNTYQQGNRFGLTHFQGASLYDSYFTVYKQLIGIDANYGPRLDQRPQPNWDPIQ